MIGSGLPFFSVQYHPEASPGPHDASYLFSRFKRLIEAFPLHGAESLDRVIAAELTQPQQSIDHRF
jgi:hypothetical protein